FGKREPRALVRDDEVARQCQFETTTEGDAVHGGDRRQRRRLNGREYLMDAFEEGANAGHAFDSGDLAHARMELPQIGTGRETGGNRAVDDDRARPVALALDPLDEPLECLEARRPDLVARFAMEFELDVIAGARPREHVGARGHAVALNAAPADSFRHHAATRSRLILPFAVSMPLSIVNGSRWTREPRIVSCGATCPLTHATAEDSSASGTSPATTA